VRESARLKIQRRLPSLAGIPHNVFDPKSTVPVVSGAFQSWLLAELFPTEPGSAESEERIDQWFVQTKRERPGSYRLDRLIGSVRQSYDERVFQAVMDRLDEPMRGKLDALLEDTGDGSPLLDLRADPGRVGLESILEEVAKLERLRTLALPADVLRSCPTSFPWEARRARCTARSQSLPADRARCKSPAPSGCTRRSPT